MTERYIVRLIEEQLASAMQEATVEATAQFDLPLLEELLLRNGWEVRDRTFQ